MKNQLVLIIHEDEAWLCRGDWKRPVEGNEFIAWATYAGIELRQLPGSSSQMVVLSTNHQEMLFDLAWVRPLDDLRRLPPRGAAKFSRSKH